MCRIQDNKTDNKKVHTVTFQSLPMHVNDIMMLPDMSLRVPEYTVALTIASLYRYTQSREDGIAMLNYLKGPRPLSNYDKQFLAERLDDKPYVAASYFTGAIPQNNYTPQMPYSVKTEEAFAGYGQDDYRKYWVFSGGADNPRSITVRYRPSSGEWFLWEQAVLADIRKPIAEDAWA